MMTKILPKAPQNEGVDPLTKSPAYHGEDVKGNSIFGKNDVEPVEDTTSELDEVGVEDDGPAAEGSGEEEPSEEPSTDEDSAQPEPTTDFDSKTSAKKK